MSRASMIARYAKTLLHERNVGSADASGGRISSWETLHSAVACAEQPASARTVARFAAVQMVVNTTIFVASDIAALADDRLTIGTRVFLVRGYRDATAGLAYCWRADCEEVL